MNSYLRLISRTSRLLSPRLITVQRHAEASTSSTTEVSEAPDLSIYPGKILDNSIHKDYVIALPEEIPDTPQTNEIIRIPKVGENDINFNKITPEIAFRGCSKRQVDFENFVSTFNIREKECEDLVFIDDTFKNFIKDIEKYIYPLDSSVNLLYTLMVAKSKDFCLPGFSLVADRYFDSRNKICENNFKQMLSIFLNNYKNLTATEKKILQFYVEENIRESVYHEMHDVRAITNYKLLLKAYGRRYKSNLEEANQNFHYTIDDPDILSSVYSKFIIHDSKHHTERTPLKIYLSMYSKFMEVCPDRLVRKMLWETRTKLCSPKGPPKLNNFRLFNNIQTDRRKITMMLGYRNFLDYKLVNNMAESKEQLVKVFNKLNQASRQDISGKLEELNTFASDHGFNDGDGIQIYDVDYWVHKYNHDVILGMPEEQLRFFFPLDGVLQGLKNYYKNYFNIDIKFSNNCATLWDKDAYKVEVYKDKSFLGTIIHDALKRPGKEAPSSIYSRIIYRNNDLNCLPLSLLSTNLKVDNRSGEVLLTFDDIVELFFGYTSLIQRLLFNYDYCDLNNYGCFETDAEHILPYLTLAHLLNDYRIVQSCSLVKTSTGTKNINSELAIRILNGAKYFKSLKTWEDLYKAHMEVEFCTSTSDIKRISSDIYSIYSPFPRAPDMYEYCSMPEIFSEMTSPMKYTWLWSKLIANFCLSQVTKDGKLELDTIGQEVIRQSNEKLLDILFENESFDTAKKLSKFAGRSFEPLETSLGVL